MQLESQIICIADNDPSYWGQKTSNYDVISPARIKNEAFDKIVVTTISGRETVANQLDDMGLTRNLDYVLIGRYPQTYIAAVKQFLNDVDVDSVLRGAHCLHIGPGGFLGFEVLLYCLGAEKVYSIDKLPFDIRFPEITGLENDYDQVKEALIDIVGSEQLGRGCLARYEDVFIKKGGRLQIDSNKIEFSHPMDICRMTYPSNSFDLIISFSVLEHVTECEAALSEVARCLKPNGISYQTVVTQDHRSFSNVGDTGPFAFRQYSSKDWDGIARKRFYQNRLLPVEWKHLHEKKKLSIQQYRIENRFDLDDETMNTFHSDFTSFSKQELCEADCTIIAKKI